MRITNKQKKDLRALFDSIKLNDALFEIESNDSKVILQLKESYLNLDVLKLSNGNYRVTSNSISNKTRYYNDYATWDGVIGHTSSWLSEVKEDMEYDRNRTLVPQNREFPKRINVISKKFVRIYNQSMSAEAMGLDEICGLGYRKSFEFLIKDYLKKNNPKSEHKKIETNRVAKCIDDYVNDDAIKVLAHRAFWLGNDHAHYVKKWTGKTLADLKDLIDQTITWIIMHEELKKIKKKMPQGK